MVKKPVGMTGPCFGDSADGPLDRLAEEDLYKQKQFVRLDTTKCLEIARMAASKAIEPRDLMLLLTIISMTNWKNGRCLATTAKLAELLPLSVSQVGHSMRRLKKQNLIVPLKDSRDGFIYHLVNPYLIICGAGSRRGLILKNYHQAIYKNTPFSDRVQIDDNKDLTDDEIAAMLDD